MALASSPQRCVHGYLAQRHGNRFGAPLMHTQLKSTDWRRAMRASSDVVGADDRQVRGVAWTRLGELEKKVIKAIEAKLEV